MSVLTPLYLLGALAIVGPIVFHFIRRSPQGEVPFSSLMFLSATPPRLTRRSRLDDWLLLLLRAAVPLLLALAFARPFLREAVALDSADVEARRVLVLIDTSASMRRGDLWQRALKLANETCQALRPHDQLSICTFDRSLRPMLTFEESSPLEPSRRSTIARSRLSGLVPTWAATDLGAALVEAVGRIEDVSDATPSASRMPRRIVLITDLQEGSELQALSTFEWPTDVELEIKSLKAAEPNAGVHRLADAEGSATDREPELRVQISNEAGASVDRFSLVWKDVKGATVGPSIDAYVPAGQSRVFRVARPSQSVPLQSLELQGDAYEFDNQLFIADRAEQDMTVVFSGEGDADDPEGLYYYLKRAFETSQGRTVSVVRHAPGESLDAKPAQEMPLIVVGSSLTETNASALRNYMTEGGTVLAVLTTPESVANVNALAEASLETLGEANVDRDVMLGEITFRHPLFAQLAAAQYNDFTKIRFWEYRRVNPESLGDAHVIARFENHDPAIIEQLIGKGRLIVLTSGWSPADSQLARSSKFVPLMMSLLEFSHPTAFDSSSLTVGDAIPLSGFTKSADDAVIAIATPSKQRVAIAADASTFNATDVPGVYTAMLDGGESSFAMNLDPSESRTLPMSIETLEQLGVKIAKNIAASTDSVQERRQMMNAELEGRQKLWRWIILATIALLVIETWLAGWLARSRRSVEEALPI